jgi:aconitate hydratase
MWNAIGGAEDDLYDFKEESTYLQDPPFFQGLTREPKPVADIRGARVLAILGDSVTTDHIAPAGDIAENSPAGRFLKARGVEKKDFNTYGARRERSRHGRATFANIRLKNFMLGSRGRHLHFLGRSDGHLRRGGAVQEDGVPLVVIAGKEYGRSSRLGGKGRCSWACGPPS